MARNLSEYNIVKQARRGSVQIEYDEALRVKELALSLAGQPGMHSIVAKSGVEHQIGYASSLTPGSHVSLGPEVQELYLQSLITPLYEGETIDQSWHALISFLGYDDRFAGDSNVRHVYTVDAVESDEGEGLVLEAQHQIFAIRNAPYEGYSSARDKTVGYSFRGRGMHKALLATAMQSEHVERLEERAEWALKRLASTSFRTFDKSWPVLAKETAELGNEIYDHPRERSQQYAFMGPAKPGDPFDIVVAKE
jgi:hypothetical protein